MDNSSPQIKRIIDFIYDKPEYVIKVLNDNGYKIKAENTTLQKIDELTFKALSDKNQKFAEELDAMITNEGYYNIIPLLISGGISLATSIIGGVFGSESARKQRQLLWDMKMAELANNEKLAYEQIRSQAETERTKILANSLLAYRQSLQSESTIRLRDTWIYLTGLGLGMGVLYGLFLITDKQ